MESVTEQPQVVQSTTSQEAAAAPPAPDVKDAEAIIEQAKLKQPAEILSAPASQTQEAIDKAEEELRILKMKAAQNQPLPEPSAQPLPNPVNQDALPQTPPKLSETQKPEVSYKNDRSGYLQHSHDDLVAFFDKLKMSGLTKIMQKGRYTVESYTYTSPADNQGGYEFLITKVGDAYTLTSTNEKNVDNGTKYGQKQLQNETYVSKRNNLTATKTFEDPTNPTPVPRVLSSSEIKNGFFSRKGSTEDAKATYTQLASSLSRAQFAVARVLPQ